MNPYAKSTCLKRFVILLVETAVMIKAAMATLMMNHSYTNALYPLIMAACEDSDRSFSIAMLGYVYL